MCLSHYLILWPHTIQTSDGNITENNNGSPLLLVLFTQTYTEIVHCLNPLDNLTLIK